MQREYYRFGGVTFAIEADAPIERSAMCAPFRVADGAAEHTIRLHFDDRLPVPPETAQHRGAVWRWQSGTERHLLEQYGAPGKPPRFTYAVTRGHGGHVCQRIPRRRFRARGARGGRIV